MSKRIPTGSRWHSRGTDRVVEIVTAPMGDFVNDFLTVRNVATGRTSVMRCSTLENGYRRIDA